jgi:PhzF family phenazine biosynthesis protein
MRTTVHIVNAFVDGGTGGNPAGVVVDANALSASQRLAVAQKVGLSETAFVSASTSASYKLEFFTPTRQIAHCGHATVATFSLLRQLGMVGEGSCSKETIDGHRNIVIQSDKAFMEQRAPTYHHLDQASDMPARVLASVGIHAGHLVHGLVPCVVNTGNSFLILPLHCESDLHTLALDQTAIESISDELDLVGFYAFTRSTKQPGRHAGARMFAPRFGIPEEAGTGMAAGPLACYLRDVMQLSDTTIFIEQGWFMPNPSPSVIEVHLNVVNQKIGGLMAGGRAQVFSSYELDL